jgi:DNA-binding XRE family transcriptional regulator
LARAAASTNERERIVSHTLVTTPGGEELVMLPRKEFEAMLDQIDAARHARIMAEVVAGQQELLTPSEVETALAEPSLLAYWRKRRALTQTGLARAVGISQSYMAALENNDRKGDPALFLRLARALNVPMEAIVEAD